MWRYARHSLYRCKTNGQINIRCTARTFLYGHGLALTAKTRVQSPRERQQYQ
jgi:hypothetical protein